MHNAFKLAIPSKGAMEEPCVRFLSDCGMPVRRASSRQYSAPLGGGVEVQAVFQRAADIPQKIVDGVVDAGITGLDIFREHGGESAEVVVAVEAVSYTHLTLPTKRIV